MCRPSSELDTRPARDVPDRELADQLRLIEAVALAVSREVGQPIQRQSCFGSLAGLPLDSLDRPTGRGLRCGHAGRRERLHRHVRP
jgi:hypothetical protein